MAGSQVVAFWDYDKESSSVSIPCVEIDAVNYVAKAAEMDAFTLAVKGVSLGYNYKESRVMDAFITPGVPPVDTDAQREKKWLVQMHDAVSGKAHTMEIPCADLSLLDTQARSVMDKTKAEYISLRDAIQALYLTDMGNAVVVDDVVFVGRNL